MKFLSEPMEFPAGVTILGMLKFDEAAPTHTILSFKVPIEAAVGIDVCKIQIPNTDTVASVEDSLSAMGAVYADGEPQTGGIDPALST
jgi:hypothetical protein